LFPFGHGLSYTEFDYSRLRVNGLRATGGDDTARVRLRVTNTGDRSGTELVHVYVGALPGVASPPRKLAGWEKVELEPGERARVRIRINRRAFSYWDGDSDRWVTPTGTVPVYVGSSASDVRLSGTVRVR
jgi:beta-glucosidase